MKWIYATIGKFKSNIVESAAYPCRDMLKYNKDILIIGFRVPGTSLRTGKSGLIPSLYATPIESPPVAFSIYYVGTTSVSHHRGKSSIMNHFYNLKNFYNFNIKVVMCYGQEYKKS